MKNVSLYLQHSILQCCNWSKNIKFAWFFSRGVTKKQVDFAFYARRAGVTCEERRLVRRKRDVSENNICQRYQDSRQ